VNAVKWGEKLN